jgi:hypothetical protein
MTSCNGRSPDASIIGAAPRAGASIRAKMDIVVARRSRIDRGKTGMANEFGTVAAMNGATFDAARRSGNQARSA